jgi:hypothetical protein
MRLLICALPILALAQGTSTTGTSLPTPIIVNFPNGTIERVYFVQPVVRSLNDFNAVERDALVLEDRSPLCKIDSILLACKGLAAKATPFCSSFLNIPVSTSIVVIQPTT